MQTRAIRTLKPVNDTEKTSRRRGRGSATIDSHGLAPLQATVGNAAVSRLIHRKDLGTGKGGKKWISTGNFDGKHLIDGTVNEATAKARYTARYNKGANVPAGTQANSVVGETELKAAMADASKVAGTYPGRTDRKKLTVTVAGMKVIGRKRGNAQVPSTASAIASIVVEGSGSESLFYPDHVAG